MSTKRKGEKAISPQMKMLKQSLHARRMTIDRLAELAGVNRPHLCAVLAGKRGGAHTRKRVEHLLTVAEKAIIGWLPEPAQETPSQMFHVEQQNDIEIEDFGAPHVSVDAFAGE